MKRIAYITCQSLKLKNLRISSLVTGECNFIKQLIIVGFKSEIVMKCVYFTIIILYFRTLVVWHEGNAMQTFLSIDLWNM
jgi:hypothetical protein